MFRQLFLCVCVAAPVCAGAQQPVRPDTTMRDSAVRADSARAAARLAVVTITATAVKRAESRQAVAVSPEQIARTPATSPWDLLRQTAGVEVHVSGQGPGFASDAAVRGFSSDHSTDLALWIDGVPVNEPVNGHAEGYNDWSLIFPQAIQDLDVIKGPTSALFGNFAFSGIVNVRTLDRLVGTRAWIDGGSAGHIEGTALSGFGNDSGSTAHGVVGARYAHESGWRPNSDYDLGQGHARLVHDFTRNTTIDGGVELYGSRWRSAGYLSEDEFHAHDYDIVSNPTDQGHKLHAQERASLRVLSGNMLWRSTVYATEGDWRLFLTIPPAGGRFEGDGSQTEEDDKRFGLGVTSALTWQLSRAELSIGAEGRFDRSHYQNWFTTNRSRDSVQALIHARQFGGGVFAQAGLDVTDRLRLDLGARYDGIATRSQPGDEVTLTGTNATFSPKAGALFKIVDALSVYANVSRGFRATDGIIEDPTLPFITVWAYESGLKMNLGNVSATAAAFRMDVSNEQTFNPLTSGSTSGGASRHQGVELSMRAPIAKTFTLSGDWTFNDARYRKLIATAEDDATQVDTLSGQRVYNTAKYVGSATLEWAPLGSMWSVLLCTNAVGPYSPFDEPGVVLPAYALLHASVTRKIGEAHLEIGVHNLLDKAYPELVAGGLVAPGQPIAVFGTVRYDF